MSDRRRPSSARRVIAALLNGTLAPKPDMTETFEQKRARILANLPKPGPRTIVVPVRKRIGRR